MRLSILITWSVLAFATPRALAQEDPRILFSGQAGFVSFPIGGALSNLGLLDQTTLVFQREDLLLPALRDGPWDLVIIRWFDAFEGPLAGDIIAELAEHVDGGGKLMFSMAELDEQSDMWPILGIESAVDVQEPLQRVQSAFGDLDPPRAHPAFGALRWEVNRDPFLPPTTDHGDVLAPSAEGFTVATYGEDGGPAIVVSHAGRVIVDGPHWDYWESGIIFAEQQLRWLLGCPADLDGDGDLTVFDFFEFQNRFDSGGAAGFADFDYNGRLDVFDFLEFFNLFDAGC